MIHMQLEAENGMQLRQQLAELLGTIVAQEAKEKPPYPAPVYDKQTGAVPEAQQGDTANEANSVVDMQTGEERAVEKKGRGRPRKTPAPEAVPAAPEAPKEPVKEAQAELPTAPPPVAAEAAPIPAAPAKQAPEMELIKIEMTKFRNVHGKEAAIEVMKKYGATLNASGLYAASSIPPENYLAFYNELVAKNG